MASLLSLTWDLAVGQFCCTTEHIDDTQVVKYCSISSIEGLSRGYSLASYKIPLMVNLFSSAFNVVRIRISTLGNLFNFGGRLRALIRMRACILIITNLLITKIRDKSGFKPYIIILAPFWIHKMYIQIYFFLHDLKNSVLKICILIVFSVLDHILHLCMHGSISYVGQIWSIYGIRQLALYNRKYAHRI